jgi:DNA-binding NarL/FixJ family response regulator
MSQTKWSTPDGDVWHREAARNGRRIVPPYDAASKTESGPSNEAGAAIRPKTTTLRDKVLCVLRRVPSGLTADEIAERCGVSLLAIRPRVTELNKAGAIEDTGLRRKNIVSGAKAAVWRICA